MQVKSEVTFTVEWDPPGKGDIEELEITVYGLVTPGTPGQINGPPERCYPPEPTETDYTGFNITDIPPLLDEFLQEAFDEKLADMEADYE